MTSGTDARIRGRSTIVVGLAAMVIVSACDWNMYRYGPARSGWSADTSISKEAVQTDMRLAWTAALDQVIESPSVANGVVYTVSEGGTLSALDANGNTNCSQVTNTCTPLWTFSTGGAPLFSTPAVVNGVVYVESFDSKLYAVDAAGVTNCSGVPKTCQPLWSATAGGSENQQSAPAVANGVVYVGSFNLFAFDAAGDTNCSGTPKVCLPLWTADTGDISPPAVANGMVYVGGLDQRVEAFDAAGNTNCGGIPKKCTPLWSGAINGFIESSLAVAGGTVYAASAFGGLYAFDAAGNANCSQVTKTCAPLWTAPSRTAGASSIAVANGVVYIDSSKLKAYDAAGNSNCSGSPKVCRPLWRSAKTIYGEASVANGVIYVGAQKLYAFDAAGTTNCSGSPTRCTPLWSANTGGGRISSPAVSNGFVYVVGGDSRLYAFKRQQPTPSQ